MASAAKIPRLNAKGIEDLPEWILVKIFRLLPMKTRVKSSVVCKRWRQHMPYASEKSVLHVVKLPFKKELIGADAVVVHSAVTDALRSLLPQPHIGPKLIGLSFASVTRRWELSFHQLELITQHCRKLSELDFGQVKCEADDEEDTSVDPFGVIPHLQQLSNLNCLALENFTSDMETSTALSQFLLDLSSLLACLPLDKLRLKDFSALPSLSCPNLTDLCLSNCNLSDVQMAQLCHTSTKLTSLSVETADDVKLDPIAKLVNLTSLSFVDCWLNEDELRSICAACKKLNKLVIDSSNINTLSSIQSLPDLNDLTAHLTDNDVKNLPANWQLPQLNTLKIAWSQDFTDAGLIGLCGRLPQLTSFSAVSRKLTDASVPAVMSTLTRLRHLHLSCTGIGDRSVALLGQSHLLETLNISHTANSTTEGIWHLAAKRRGTQMGNRLTLRVGIGHKVWKSQLVEELKAELNSVNVTLTI